MKSLQKSWGKICRPVYVLIGASLVAGLVACQLPTRHNDETSAQANDLASTEKSTSGETSLQEDQKTIDELRQNIPTEKRVENDQLKAILSLTGEVKENPSRIREKFSKQTQRMREIHRRETKKSRDTFNKNERKSRDAFYDKLKKEREDNKKEKMSRDERKEFFDNQDQRRRDFSADERDKRNQFNADLKIKDDDFNTMMRDKNNEFNAQMRDYTTRYNEWQKQKNKKSSTGRGADGSQLQMFQPIEEAPKAVPLKTGDDDK